MLCWQYWMMSKAGEIRRDETCLDYAGQDVILYPCHGSKGNQFWQYNPDVSIISSPIIKTHTPNQSAFGVILNYS